MKTTRVPKWCVGILLAASPARAASILDGGFESPATTTPNLLNSGYVSKTVGSSFGGPGNSAWTVVLKGSISSDVALGPATEYLSTSPKYYYNSNSGNQYLDLTGSPDNGATVGVQQTVVTTIGQTYDLSFFVGHQTFNPGSAVAELDINGTSVGVFTNGIPSLFPSYNGDGFAANSWVKFDYVFTASSTSTVIAFYNQTAAGNSINGLDDVAITEVPLPSTAWATLALLGGFGISQLRRKANPSAG